MENLFLEWLAANSIEIEAFTFRAGRDWCPDQYIFRFRRADGDWSGPNILPWGISTFVKAQEIIGEVAP